MSRTHIPASVLCHRNEVLRARRKPPGWRQLFAECPVCLAPMRLGFLRPVGGGEPVPLWHCPPCLREASALWRELAENAENAETRRPVR